MGSGGDKEMGSEGDDMRLLRTPSILDRLMALPKWLRTGWRVSPTPHLLVSLSLFLLHASTAHAGAMLLHIGTTTPRGAQRGTTLEVTIQGMCLKEAKEIVFFRPGIRATGIEALPNLKYPIGLKMRCCMS